MFRVCRLKNKAVFAFALIVASILAGGCQEQAASVANTNSGPAGNNKVTDFDASRAYGHLKKLVEIGPRPPGTEAIKKTQEYIQGELGSYGLKVIEDKFTAETTRGPFPMKNIIAELPGEKLDIVIVAGHYDTKMQPGFVGANDGGSSTAAVLEMARVLARTKPEYTLWFVLFDGEEAFVDWSANNGMDNTYGSRHLASKLKADGTLSRVKAMVLVDMIGDKNLDILRDGESTPWLVDVVWKTAREIGYGKHFLGNEGGYSDDHIPFKEAGVPVIDIIDFDYGPGNAYWHTNHDTLDKVSGESVKIVGDVVIRALPEIFKELNTRKK
jgi:Zn-dependent M28 family amino/carboxypeptidase